ncbi:class I SAM-dependent methyltransferase [Kitasatospora sp. RB6PN24]|uniref:class I SAM-dependent methyltransferase n=1 Tax=Kitasatospora humi TaxID=2893891 RepID=UPI001E607157|nr:class I SAM-dependent methyltransferase [Kitasatospora humi]MCC9310993.1 class I SAM-dependent methyltransferase [Kitasatospora humi]
MSGTGADSGAWDARYSAAEPVWGVEPNRWVVRETARLPPGRALDLAAGEGRNSIWLAARGWQVTAVDFSGVALERARHLAAAQSAEIADRLRLVRADVLTYRPEPGGFGLVLVAYLQLPAEQRATALRNAAAALAPGGTLLVVGHDTSNLTDGVGGPQDARVLFAPDDVLNDLAGLGLTTVCAERVRRPVPRPDGPPVEAIDALVRLERPR